LNNCYSNRDLLIKRGGRVYSLRIFNALALQGALKERDREIAQALKTLGDPVEKIAQATGLSAEEIAAL
jgi:hypothetical protein